MTLAIDALATTGIKVAAGVLALLVLVVVVCGDPGEKFVVRSVDGAGKRVGGVKLEFFCPGNFWRADSVDPLGKTNENGLFVQEGIGSTSKKCIVRAVGHVHGALVREVCTSTRPLFGSCLAFDAVVSVAD